MSYEICRKIKYNRDTGIIELEVAESNVRPLYWMTTKFYGTVADLLESISEGNIHPYKNCTKKIMDAAAEIDKIGRTCDKAGLDHRTMFDLDLSDRNLLIREACEMFAERIETNSKEPYEDFTKRLSEEVRKRIEKGLKNIEKRKDQDKKDGIIRASTASRSIFEDSDGNEYDLLFPIENYDGPILAPGADYDNHGVLQTSPEKIVRLGKEAGDLYSYLSFTGIDLSLEEYISLEAHFEKGPVERETIVAKFRRVDESVKKAISSGLRLKSGVTPYVGFAMA